MSSRFTEVVENNSKSKRLNNLGKIDRDKTLNFTWDNKKLSGFEGDSLTSALLANNIGIVGRVLNIIDQEEYFLVV